MSAASATARSLRGSSSEADTVLRASTSDGLIGRPLADARGTVSRGLKMAKIGSKKGMGGVGDGEWGMGNGDGKAIYLSPLPTPHSSHSLLAFFAVLAVFASALWALIPSGLSSQPQSPSQISNAGYVEPSACAECHREIAESYSHTAMARTFGAVRS